MIMSLKRISLFVTSLLVLLTASTAFAADGYIYTSDRFGYSIKCPQKPLAVLNLSVLSPQEQGDVLVFANDGYTLTKYWIVSPNAFSNDTFPDLNTISDKDKNELFAHMAADRGYQELALVDLNGQKAIYAVAAKTIQIDSDKDGKVDKTIEQNGQYIDTYFKGKNSNYCVALYSKDAPTQEDINAYQYGLLSFRETK